jgi:dihydroorotase-like cyclic amidohydrolase
MSPALDLLVSGGTVVSPRGTVAADIGVADGLIVWIGAPRWAPAASRIVDASGLYVLPGVIDPHVHMTAGSSIDQFCVEQMPSMIAGGVTTCFHFSETFGAYLSALTNERAVINSQALLDVGFHAILMKDIHLEELAACRAQFGVMSYKMYFAGGGAELYPGTLSVDDGYLFDAFRRITGLGPGAVAMTHCENWEIADVLTRELQASGRNDPAAWTDARPAFCEEDGMRRAIFLAEVTKCPLYIVHSSIGRVAELVASARRDGTNVVAETCPHYLTIHRDHPRALHAKYNPAVKSESDLEALWQGLREGWVSTLGSDHIPMKTIGGRDIWETEGGVPGSGTILPVLLSEGVNKGRISLEKVVEVSSENTARVFGLPQKGRIAVGADADLVLVDLHKRVTVTPELLHTDITLFDGWEMTGWPVMTVLRGNVLFEDGEVRRQHGIGRYVRDHRP